MESESRIAYETITTVLDAVMTDLERHQAQDTNWYERVASARKWHIARWKLEIGPSTERR